MKNTNWWQTAFDEQYLRTRTTELTPERTTEEIDLVISLAQLQPTQQILDLGCGHGRHTIELARRGFPHVTGLDYSAPSIKKAIVDAQASGVKAEFVEGDMKDLPYVNQFDVILSLYMSFGYFDDKDNQQTFHEVFKALKPGGTFFLDVYNNEYIAQEFDTRGTPTTDSDTLAITVPKEIDGVVVNEVESYNPKTQRIHHLTVWPSDKPQLQEFEFSIKLYSLEQYHQMLETAGFESITHQIADYRMYLTAKKP